MTKQQLNKFIQSVLDEIAVDRSKDWLSSMRSFPQNKISIPFKVDDAEYEFIAVEDNIGDKKKASIVFKNISAVKSVDKKDGESLNSYSNRISNAKTGITKTGKNMRVFNQVYNILISYLEKYKPNYLYFVAQEENRKTLYIKILERVQKSTDIKLKKLDHDPQTSYSLKDNEFCFELYENQAS